MTLNSDLILYHPLWERADIELVGKDGTIGLFNRLIDVYVLACAIGIREDTILEPDEPLESPKSIARNTYSSMANADLRDLLDFLMQNALLTSKQISLDNDERIRLAFDPDYSISKFSIPTLLNGFANYGLSKIFEVIDSQTPVTAIDGLYEYFSSFETSKFEDILKNLTLERLSE